MKTLYIIAGANGSGKTTFAINFAKLENFKFINADEIAKKFDPKDIQKYKVKAGKYLIKVIEKAKKKGFYINLIYLFLETEDENIYRVKNRVLNGGHNVPIEDIRRRYKRSRELFINLYSKLVDEWMLVFNGDDNFEIVEDNNELHDEDLKTIFLQGIINE